MCLSVTGINYAQPAHGSPVALDAGMVLESTCDKEGGPFSHYAMTGMVEGGGDTVREEEREKK